MVFYESELIKQALYYEEYEPDEEFMEELIDEMKTNV